MSQKRPPVVECTSGIPHDSRTLLTREMCHRYCGRSWYQEHPRHRTLKRKWHQSSSRCMISTEVFFFLFLSFFFFFNAIDVLVTGVVWFSNSINLRGFVGTISLKYTYFSGFWAVFSSSIETNSHKSCTIDHTLSEETLRIKIFFLISSTTQA